MSQQLVVNGPLATQLESPEGYFMRNNGQTV